MTLNTQISTIKTPDVSTETIGDGQTVQSYRVNELLHRDDGPALVTSYRGKVIEKQWCQHGKLDRADGPALIRYDLLGRIFEESWYKKGILHRIDGSAMTLRTFNDAGLLETREHYFYLNRLHRIGGPAHLHIVRDECVDMVHALFGIPFLKDNMDLYEELIQKDLFEIARRTLEMIMGLNDFPSTLEYFTRVFQEIHPDAGRTLAASLELIR